MNTQEYRLYPVECGHKDSREWYNPLVIWLLLCWPGSLTLAKWHSGSPKLPERDRHKWVQRHLHHRDSGLWRTSQTLPSLPGKERENMEEWQILFSWVPKSLWMVTAATKLKDACSFGRKAMTNPDSVLKSRAVTLSKKKVWIVRAMVFPVVTYRCQSWTIKKAESQRIDVFKCGAGEDSWESLDCKVIKWVNPKGDHPWILTRRTDAEAPILWPSDVKSWLIGKDPDAGKYWRQKENGAAEDEMVR